MKQDIVVILEHVGVGSSDVSCKQAIVKALEPIRLGSNSIRISL
jgi:hypothetical protein